MIICRRCKQLAKWQADKICLACKDTRAFDGQLGAISIHDRPLTAEEIAKIFNRRGD